MQDVMTDTLAILGACLVVAILALAIVLFRPAARRRRRHKRHSTRPKIDLFQPAQAGSAETNA
ncbi:MAG TPA: hypothetical protein VFR28_01345 [Allosphingosinicella sp.]|nr:hypothetical protein [Allosphingosinicella sp.]